MGGLDLLGSFLTTYWFQVAHVEFLKRGRKDVFCHLTVPLHILKPATFLDHFDIPFINMEPGDFNMDLIFTNVYKSQS